MTKRKNPIFRIDNVAKKIQIPEKIINKYDEFFQKLSNESIFKSKIYLEITTDRFYFEGWFQFDISNKQIDLPDFIIEIVNNNDINVKIQIITTILKDFIEYYEQYKKLAILHKYLGFGNSPRSSESFSERLCCLLKKLYIYKETNKKTRSYDATDEQKNRIEIKATTDPSCPTTMNKDNEVFDYLYWLYFNLKDDKLTISVMPSKNFNKLKNKADDRPDVRLTDYSKKNAKIFKYIIDINKKEITEITEP